MTVAYCDCFSGVAGDMFLGAIVDVGLPVETLREDLGTLPLDGWKIEASTVDRCGVSCTLVTVKVDSSGQPHRHLRDILAIVEKASLPDPVQTKVSQVFRRLAEAEARVHRCPVEEVHFHEVGAVDAIIDVVGTVAGLFRLEVEELFSSPVNTGRGMVKTSHGLYPVPGPATLALLEGAPCYADGPEMELTTPTGAALLTTLASSFGPLPPMVPKATGYGAGQADVADRPNALRLILGRPEPSSAGETTVVLETFIDDCSPEVFDHLMDRCFASGALDVSLTPIHMKKNRPGVALTVIAPPGVAEDLTEVIFQETTTFGIRRTVTRRAVLDRETIMVDTPWGQVPVKVGRRAGRILQVSAEYEDCRKIAKAKGLPLRAVQSAAESAAWMMLTEGRSPS